MTDDPHAPRDARIRLDALGGGTVEVGGHDISKAVRGFTLTSEVGHMPSILLDLLVFTGEVEVEGDLRVHVPDETTAALVALGWTPPPTEPLELITAEPRSTDG